MGLSNELEIIRSFFYSKTKAGYIKPKRIFEFFLGIFTVVAIMWAWGYISLLRSDEYAFASSYIQNNLKVIEALGPVKSTRPGVTNFKTSYGAGMWTAKFQIVVKGNKQGTAYLQMTNSANSWVINGASIVTEDGNKIALDP